MKEEESNKGDGLTLIFHSGAYDRVSYGLSLAKGALATGMEVHALFTFGALRRLVKGGTDDLGKETEEETRRILEKSLAKENIQPLSQQIKETKHMGLKIYACVNAMANFNVSRDELISEVDKPMGIATFLELARKATISLYI